MTDAPSLVLTCTHRVSWPAASPNEQMHHLGLAVMDALLAYEQRSDNVSSSSVATDSHKGELTTSVTVAHEDLLFALFNGRAAIRHALHTALAALEAPKPLAVRDRAIAITSDGDLRSL